MVSLIWAFNRYPVAFLRIITYENGELEEIWRDQRYEGSGVLIVDRTMSVTIPELKLQQNIEVDHDLFNRPSFYRQTKISHQLKSFHSTL